MSEERLQLTRTAPDLPASPGAPIPSVHRASGRLDLAGAVVSCACACHCVALPAIVALAPALGLATLLDKRVEVGLFTTTLLIGTLSLGLPAWRATRARGWWHVPGLFVLGALLLGTARVLEARGVEGVGDIAVVAGAACIAGAHVANWRRLRAARQRAGADAACCPCPADRELH